jgi:hypothetical protein
MQKGETTVLVCAQRLLSGALLPGRGRLLPFGRRFGWSVPSYYAVIQPPRRAYARRAGRPA